MANTELPHRKSLPSWLAWYLNYDLDEKRDRLRRRQYTANLLGLLGAGNLFAYALLHLYLGLSDFWPFAVMNVAAGIFLLGLPLVFNFSATIGAVYFVFPVCFSICVFSALGSTATGVQLNLFVAPVATLLIVGPKRNDLVIFVTFSIISMLVVCEVFFKSPIVEAANWPAYLFASYIFLAASAAANIVVLSYVALLRAERAEDALEAEHARSEALLYNLLPEDIAARLKVEPDKTIADNLPKVAILFADIVDFTPRAAFLPPEEVVGFLNKVFSAFDELAEKHGLEKIKTIGDAYMVAAGMPSPVGDPVHRIAEMALDMQRTVQTMSPDFPEELQVRIGLHAGPAVAGVIGNRKLFYDVWGETVNTASRMESHGEPGRIQVTTAAKEELDDAYEFEQRGTVEVKGLGKVETWFLAGSKVVN